jgi:hypothetical protein
MGVKRMRLVLQLVARLLVVVVLCLAAATIEAYCSVDHATEASAERVSQALQRLYWHELLLRGSRTRPIGSDTA